MSQFSAKPTVDLRPADAGVDVIVRFVTRANERFELSNRIYQAMLSRGYSEEATGIHFFTRPIPTRDKWIAGASAAAMVLLAVANFRWH